MTITSIPVFHTLCIYAGDFNCCHTDRVYNDINADEECLAAWAASNDLILLQSPKGYPTLHLRLWKSETNADLAWKNSNNLPTLNDEYLESFQGHFKLPDNNLPPHNIYKQTGKALGLLQAD